MRGENRKFTLTFLAFTLFATFAQPHQEDKTQKWAKWALIVVCTYPRKPRFALRSPANDLVLLKDICSVYGIPPTNILILKDEEATKKRIVNAFRELAKKIQPYDTVFIAFSLHGGLILDIFNFPEAGVRSGDEEDGEDEVLVPYDARAGDPRTFLIDDEICFLLQSLKANRKILVIDACASGDAYRGKDFDWMDTVIPSGEQERGMEEGFTILISATVDNKRKVHADRIQMTNPPSSIIISPLTFFLWCRTLQNPGITYGRLLHLLSVDHQRHGLEWQPGLYAPPNALNQSFLSCGSVPKVDWNEKIKLNCWGEGDLSSKPIDVKRKELIQFLREE